MRSLATAVLSTAVAAAGLSLVTEVPASAATQLVKDGGFEAAVFGGSQIGGDSPDWVEADSIYGSPLCNDNRCGTGGGASAPRTGDVWAWFGGINQANHTAKLSQSVTIPAAATASLSYWTRWGAVNTVNDAVLTVKVDTAVVATYNEPAAAEAAYTKKTVDLGTYANGAPHTISFEYTSGAGAQPATTSIVMDDVTVDLPDPLATPTVTSVTPTGPSASTTPKVKGTADTGSTVTLYGASTCTGSPLGSGSAAAFAADGITATVPANATTTIYAKATKAGQPDSTCSTTSVTYTSDSTAPALPVVTGVTPASPGASTTPSVKGTAETGSTVKVFTSADCSGTPAATGTAAAFAATGLQVGVAPSSTTTFKATATDAAGNASGCSTTSATYTQQLSNTPPAAPETTLTTVPGKKVTTKKKKAKVSFGFSSPAAGATFQCSLDGAAFTACTSPATYKLGKGKHTFAVRAVVGGAVDATPATTTVKVKVKRKK